MRLRLLFTLGLVLCMATIASSNECLRNCRHATACKASGSATPENAPSGKACSGKASGDDATGETPAKPVDGEYSTLLVSKLLYI